MNLSLTRELVFCLVCGECLGEHRPLFAKKHIEANPTHLSFLPKRIIDPLILNDLDSYIARLKAVSPEMKRLKDSWDSPEEGTEPTVDNIKRSERNASSLPVKETFFHGSFLSSISITNSSYYSITTSLTRSECF